MKEMEVSMNFFPAAFEGFQCFLFWKIFVSLTAAMHTKVSFVLLGSSAQVH